MELRRLGRTDLDVSLICLGTMTWGRQNSLEDGLAQMDYALDRGVFFWDTAEMYPIAPTAETYGRTEEIIGEWFASRGKRDKVILANKAVGPRSEEHTSELQSRGHLVCRLLLEKKKIQSEYEN